MKRPTVLGQTTSPPRTNMIAHYVRLLFCLCTLSTFLFLVINSCSNSKENREMVVVEYAKSGRSTCHTCKHLIEKDTLRIGTTVSNEGYINIEWHHDRCFWDKRSRQYYYRKNKRINTVLKVEQFSGLHGLGDAEFFTEFEEKIRQANLRWASPEALEKHGITEPVAEDHTISLAVEPAATTTEGTNSKRTRGRKRKAN